MNTTIENEQTAKSAPDLKTVCIASCRKFLEEINKTRRTILAQFRGLTRAHEHLLDLALNEAEALAVQSGFPHLVFPTLALEKAQAVDNWAQKQRELQRRTWFNALAA